MCIVHIIYIISFFNLFLQLNKILFTADTLKPTFGLHATIRPSYRGRTQKEYPPPPRGGWAIFRVTQLSNYLQVI
jgi:hypothetical protein